MNTNEVIRYHRERLGLSKQALADRVGVTRASILMWESGETTPKRARESAVAAALGISVDELMGKGAPSRPSSQNLIREPSNIEPGPEIKGRGRYPVLSEVQAGNWREVCGDTHEPDEWGVSHHNLGECGYMLRVVGNSMTNTESGARFSFPEGMMLHVNPHAEALPGKFVIVRRESEKAVTFKRLQMMDGDLYLEAINPAWPARYIKLKPGDEICGVVVDASFGCLP